MKIRPILMLGWLLGLSATSGQEATDSAPLTKPEPVMAPEDTEHSEGGSGDDPFASNLGQAERIRIPLDRGKEVRTALQLRLEVWELETRKLTAGLDAVSGPDELEGLRKGLLADPAATLLHSLVSSTDEKSRTYDESILEFIYPTEYEPPVGPPGKPEPVEETKENAEWQRWLDAAGKYSVPTSFETRNTGSTLETAIQPVHGEEGKTWDVSLSFENVALAGMISYGADDLLIEMPAFTSIRTSGIVRLREGEWRIKSVKEAPRGKDAKATGKSWLTLVRVDRAR